MTDLYGDDAFAFPFSNEIGGGAVAHCPGMTLRDYFAGQALTGMISTAAAPSMMGWQQAENRIAETAYEMADAMLEARNA